MTIRTGRFVLFLATIAASASFRAAAPLHYRVAFPEPHHRWLQVEARFTDLGTAPLELRMSRSSPGRYSLHDFAKNVYDVHVVGADGRQIAVARPDAHGWTAAGHGGGATVRYKVFGDRVDGTYLGIDRSHAHINMPAAIMWARGLEDRAVTVTFDPPSGRRWQVATQLQAGATPFEFSAPNLQYLMDSPAEIGPLSIRQFAVGDRRFRLAVHHTGSDAELDAFVKDVEKIVREEGAIYGEYPAYEPGHYTFIADYLPYAVGDAMEHRNSAVITSPGSLANDRVGPLDSVAHEFFHGWNVERIRPRSLEPFDFERANMSGELWLAEGFTQYYAPLVLSRTGLVDLPWTVATMASFVRAALLDPARTVRSAEEMSLMAVFTDGGRTTDRTNWSNTVVSYYELGGGIALALDLTLRGRSGGAVTLDDYMRAMWRVHGKPGGMRPGYVDRPYTIVEAEERLADVSGDPAFARDFFARYIKGRDTADYARLLAPAGLVLRKRNPGRAWWGNLQLDVHNGAVSVGAPPALDVPAYAAGLDVGDRIVQLDGTPISSPADVDAVLRRRRPGDTLAVVFVDRTGASTKSNVMLREDPDFLLAPVESAGGRVTPEQKRFREGWLN